jgi:signal transduction histidine kinase
MAEPGTPDFPELLRRQESLRKVIEAISGELELRPLLTLIVEHACELLGADRGTIGLVDEARGVVRTEAIYRMTGDEMGAEMARGVGLAGQVYETRQPLLLDRYGDVDQPIRPGMSEDAVIGVPIFWRERMIGFFGLGAAPPRRFARPDVEVLSLFARHAAIAIENARLYDGTRRALEEVRLLYETSRRIATAMDIEEVVAAYLDQVAARGRYACSVGLYAVDETGERTEVIVRGRWSPSAGTVLGEQRYPRTRDGLDPGLDAGQTVTIADVHTDARASDELRAIQARDGRPALAMIPLMARGRRIGIVVLSDPRVHDWPDEDLRPYQVTAAQLATAIESRRQQILLYERGQQLAVLEERQRLARELHDSVTQTLFSITLISQSISPVWHRDAAEGERRLQRLHELGQSALAEMRALLAELRPARATAPPSAGTPQPLAPQHAADLPTSPGIGRVRQCGLAAALLRHVGEVAADGPPIDLDAAGYQPQSPATEEALYRIAQEALHNVVKHAQANHIQIRLSAENKTCRLTVTDDGIGFVPHLRPSASSADEGLSSAGGYGLHTMRERAEELGGTLRIRTAPGRGTTVEATVPEEG